MENYLINPLWIYLIDIISDVEILSIICLCIGIVGCVIFGVWRFFQIIDGYYDDEDGEFRLTKFWVKTSIIMTIISAIITCVIPSEKTMYTMFISSYITEENLNSATETVTDVVDYIFEKVDELQGE